MLLTSRQISQTTRSGRLPYHATEECGSPALYSYTRICWRGQRDRDEGIRLQGRIKNSSVETVGLTSHAGAHKVRRAAVSNPVAFTVMIAANKTSTKERM